MAAKSTYLENKVLDHALGTTAYTKPTNTYIALYTTSPTVADTGTEVTGGSYARQVAAWSAASGGSTSNSGIISFTNMPATTVTHMGIRDASSAGNLLYWAPLTASQTTTAGSTLQFNAGSITPSES